MTQTQRFARVKSLAQAQFFRHFPRLAGVAVGLMGFVVALAWLEHWTAVVQMLPNFPPMKFNTALAFILCGAGLLLLTTRHAAHARWPGAIAALTGLLTLVEYLTGKNLAIDQLFITDYLRTATLVPGRMTSLAAICFLCNGIVLVLLSLKAKGTWRLTGAGLLAAVAGVIAAFIAFCYVLGIESASGWGAYMQMAPHTAVAFLVLGGGILVRAWQVEPLENFIFVRWLPVAVSAVLMLMIAVVSVRSFRQLEKSAEWHKHTVEVILAAQSFQDNFLDISRGVRGYVTMGDTNALASYENSLALEPLDLDRLVELTRDNPAQQHRLQNLSTDVEAALAYDTGLIDLYRQQGAEAVFKLDATGKGRKILGHERETLRTFSQEEQRLLDVRDDTEQSNFSNTAQLLTFGSVLSAVLLLLANWIASRELIFRRRAEAKLVEQAAALKRSNTELEQFAYVASHDMREPLRAVSGFAQILKNSQRDKLDKGANDMIGHIVDGAKRMAAIIDDLLALSHIGSQGRPFEKTEIEKPLSQALMSLSVAIAERKAVVHHDPLPALPADSSQLSLLFQNLIANAIKFCRDKPPEIRVKAVKEPGGFWKISVSDNGIGIEPKYFDRIFGIFQRLHTREEYPGTGIGLAICKKIVERHGGQIWPESKLGEGTTFHFTLPEKPAVTKT